VGGLVKGGHIIAIRKKGGIGRVQLFKISSKQRNIGKQTAQQTAKHASSTKQQPFFL
tara:strand:- start:213 stop:383 length:171 start_codon:yes stop_codon:yes gene_type:complete